MNPTNPSPPGRQPNGWRDELRRALGPEPPDAAAARRTAYRIALCFGSCRLFGVELGELDAPLPGGRALAATEEWAAHLVGWGREAARLDQVWSDAVEETEALDLAAGLLTARTESWAVFLALDEAYQGCGGPSTIRRQLGAGLHAALDSLERFDAVLRGNATYLAPVAGTPLLEEWRQALAPDYRTLPPWWLDGTLEDLLTDVREGETNWLPASLRPALSTGRSAASEPTPRRSRRQPHEETHMATPKAGSDFYREYDLADARRRGGAQTPAPHQAQALRALETWSRATSAEPRGGILVLPTGGGKTFTAGHFLCRNPLSEGYKVLWLAHTHHLLEQAFGGFEKLAGLIAEPQPKLNVRVVSGTVGHFPPHAVRATDDVLVCSLQTASNALTSGHERLGEFLDAAGGKLFVVFDEAHHAPAPSYRKLVQGLRSRCPGMHLLGLTATPTHSEVKKRGWLKQLFPQEIVYEIDPQTLMAAGVLARPVLEEARTEFEPAFDEREYEQWVGTNRDLPEDVIGALANSRERNDRIIGHYVANRERYGKTIIFADRWPQCEYLREALRRRDVRADAIYSHVDANPGTVEGRARRTASENAAVLRDFRAGKLDVLINIRMATEGTDVPDVRTVFLTRQTTSQILLTQMVGRALRGPKFGGTDEAHIVSFIDDWRHRINWAAYDRLAPGLADESVPEYGARPPLQLISIDLVRRLARQMDSGVNVNPAPYRAFLPVGWYRVEYAARIEGTDDDESVGQLVMVFEDEQPSFKRLLVALAKSDLSAFEEPAVRLEEVREVAAGWEARYFADAEERIGGGRTADLLAIARHMAQDERRPPRFFPFGVRDDHDLDAVAQRVWTDDLGPRRVGEVLESEYTRRDRYWRVIYHTYDQFKSHFDACLNRLSHANRHQADPADHRPTFRTPESVPVAEPPDEIKDRVRSRDKHLCLCCGYGKRRSALEVDHISPSYHGGNNHFDNLQTLCKTCNGAKGVERISFRNNQTALTTPPPRLPAIKAPNGESAREAEWWEMYVRRTLNLFFRCAAVDSVAIAGRGERFRHWAVRLFPGNDPTWVEPHLAAWAAVIRKAREDAGYTAAPDQITVTG